MSKFRRHVLSKSSFLKGVQCSKALYLGKYHNKLKDPLSKEQLQQFKKGHDTGQLARQLFPGGMDMTPEYKFDYRQALENTMAHLKIGQEVLYEAAFQFEDILVLADIIVNNDDGLRVYEVKSSSAIKETHLMDAALQYYVIESSGYQINDFSVIYVDAQQREQGQKDAGRLFNIRSVLADVIELQPFVGNKIQEFKEMLSLRRMPDIAMGEHCSYPYKCDFMDFCKKHVHSGIGLFSFD